MHASISWILGGAASMVHSTENSTPRPEAAPSAPASIAEVAGKEKGRKRSAPDDAERDDEARAEEMQSILDQITAAGDMLTHEVKKVAELQTPSGQVVYLVKT
jgi:hypothetical protein